MYAISIERTFSAAHALRFLDGSEEEIHGHNWQVVVEVQRDGLDELGLVVDFHLVEQHLDGLLALMHNRNLNAHPAFVERNPSAENVAGYLFERLEAMLDIAPARLWSVTVSEAPGCRATRRRGPLPG